VPFWLLLIALLSSSGAPGVAADLAMPYESLGACPFECCTYRTWTVEADTTVLSERTEGSSVAFRVPRGQRVVGVTGVVVVTKPGVAVVRRAARLGKGRRTATVKPGDRLLVLHPLGEGHWKLWVDGRHVEDQIADIDDGCENTDREPVACDVQITIHPEFVWWAQVRSRGRIGWTRELDHFGNIDACG
jgi:hypothetical protein